jgi:hypothetical protein
MTTHFDTLVKALMYYSVNQQDNTLAYVFAVAQEDAKTSCEAAGYVSMIRPFIQSYGDLTVKQICSMKHKSCISQC